MAEHRIDLQRNKRGFGGDTMLLNGNIIGRSEQPLYDAARWLLANNAAAEPDTLATYRGGTRCMSGIVGELAKLTVAEAKHGNPSLYLRPYVPFSAFPVASRTAETAAPVHSGMEPELEAVT